MNFIENIQKALDIALKQFGVDNGIIVALEDINAPTDTSIPYLSSFQNNASVATSELGTNDIRNGFYQIDINYEHGLGSTLLNRMADNLNAVFYNGATFDFSGVCVVIENVEPGVIIVGGGWAKLPVTINWNSRTTQF